MATKKKSTNAKSTTKEETVEPKEETVVEETVETKEQDVVEETREQQTPKEDTTDQSSEESKDKDSPRIAKGQVYGTLRLRLRKRPLANDKTEIVKVLQKDTAVTVNLDQSTENYYHVTVGNHAIAPVGYCDKKYIQLEEE